MEGTKIATSSPSIPASGGGSGQAGGAGSRKTRGGSAFSEEKGEHSEGGGTKKARAPDPGEQGIASHVRVSFTLPDGTEKRGWYYPARNALFVCQFDSTGGADADCDTHPLCQARRFTEEAGSAELDAFDEALSAKARARYEEEDAELQAAPRCDACGSKPMAWSGEGAQRKPECDCGHYEPEGSE
jgi:hypothetical protein